MAVVGCIPCPGYGAAAVHEAVRAALSAAGSLERLLPAGGRVLVKPNVIDVCPPWRAATTHPAVVEAVARLAAGAGCRVAVGDCSGGSYAPGTDRALEVSGITEAARRAGAELINLQRAPRQRVELSAGQPRAVEVALPALEADLVVTVPKLKTHALTLLTGAVKNSFGCLPGDWKSEVHRANPTREGFSLALAAIHAEVRPALAVMDAVVGMEGEGPCSGTPRRVGAVLASADAVALDAVAAHLIGYEPGAVPTTRLAAAMGLGVSDLGSIEVRGADLEGLRVPDFRKPLAQSSDGRDVAPELDPSRCNACGACLAACPVGAISLAPKPVHDRARCIRCLCCAELCPQGAVLARPAGARQVPSLDPDAPAWLEGGRRVALSRTDGSRMIAGRALLLEPVVGRNDMEGLGRRLLARRPPLVVLAARVDPGRAGRGDGRALLSLYRALREDGMNLVILNPVPPCVLPAEDAEDARSLGVPSAGPGRRRPGQEGALHERCRGCVHLLRGRCPGSEALSR